ncbi:MAG: hypothetical protein GX061_07265 [Eubacteriaceae bacterium]|nr:hypothetical protein [Eubacteriaceae bacterium]
MVCKNHKRIISILKQKKAMTMVNVLAAFAIFMIAVSFFSRAVTISVSYIRQAEEVREKADDALLEYYQDPTPANTPKNCRFLLEGEPDTAFTVYLEYREKQYEGFTMYLYDLPDTP